MGNRLLRRSYKVDFVIAKVAQPILGIGFLVKYNIIVNCKQFSLTDGETGITAACQQAEHSMPISISLDSMPPAAQQLSVFLAILANF